MPPDSSKKRSLNESDFLTIQAKEDHFSDSRTMDSVEKNMIKSSIARNNRNLTKVAKELGIGRTSLYRKLEKYGL